MPLILSTLKNYISTGGFLAISLLLYIFGDSNKYTKAILEYVLSEDGRVLAFITLLGFILIHEICAKTKGVVKKGHEEIKANMDNLQIIIEKGRLISDVNSAFTEFKANGKEFITGEYYIKEIMTLSDTRERLSVNSYTQNKLNFLISKIKHDL